MKYYCLKCHICWEINNLISCLAFIGQWAFCFILFPFASMSCKNVNRFFTIFSGHRWPIDLKLLQVCQFIYLVDYIKYLHCQQLFCQPNQLCNVLSNCKLSRHFNWSSWSDCRIFKYKVVGSNPLANHWFHNDTNCYCRLVMTESQILDLYYPKS